MTTPTIFAGDTHTVKATITENGSPVSLVGATGASNAGGGYGFYFNGDIAEIVVYSRALSATERQQVETYLSQKYNITVA